MTEQEIIDLTAYLESEIYSAKQKIDYKKDELKEANSELTYQETIVKNCEEEISFLGVKITWLENQIKGIKKDEKS